jgi:hypothetical protein
VYQTSPVPQAVWIAAAPAAPVYIYGLGQRPERKPGLKHLQGGFCRTCVRRYDRQQWHNVRYEALFTQACFLLSIGMRTATSIRISSKLGYGAY